MPELSALLAFCVAAIVLFVVPGPVVLYVVTRSVAQGRRAGLVSVAGVHLGSLVHIAAAVAGLSAVLARSATAFTIVKWAGAAYLVILGIRALAERTGQAGGAPVVRVVSLSTVFRQGFVVNLLNPKTAVFFLAFVPQFLDASANTTTQLLVLGALFVVLGTLSDGLYAVAAGGR
jgi:threonine/homoserine/homoserine lactone efflux protein